MTAEQLRFWKHELRTPINHIVGYSELLMEEAGDAGETRLASKAKDILVGARALAKLMERELPASPLEFESRPLTGLKISMKPAIQDLLASCTALNEYRSYDKDLKRIESAIKRLANLLEAPDRADGMPANGQSEVQ